MTRAAAPKVLMIAYACNPEGTGEHWLGWGWAEQAAKNHQVHLLTTPNARGAIERHAPRHGIQPHFVSLSGRWHRITGRLGRFGAWLRKLAWVYRAARVAEELHAREQFALVHQTTFHTFRIPFLGPRLNLPSVWGPVAGGENIPPGFAQYYGPVLLPAWLHRWFNRLCLALPAVQQSLVRADVIFVSNHTTMQFLGPKVAAKCVVVPANAVRVEDEQKPVPVRDRTDPTFRLLYVGNCLATRAMPLAFAALARARLRNCEFVIIGSGVGLALWQRKAREFGVADQVKFLGQLPHAQLASYYETADLLVFPALRDSGGSALLEAMSKGVPVICLDWGGPAEMVDADSGVKIPVTTPAATIEAFAAALTRLQADAGHRAQLSRCAVERTRRLFTWAAKRELLEQTYRRLLTAR